MHAIDGFVEQGGVDAKHGNSKRGDCAANELCDIGIWRSLLAASIGGEILRSATQLVRVLSDLRDHGLIQIIGDDPVNVAVYATTLNNLTLKGTFLSLTMMPFLSCSSFQSIASRWI